MSRHNSITVCDYVRGYGQTQTECYRFRYFNLIYFSSPTSMDSHCHMNLNWRAKKLSLFWRLTFRQTFIFWLAYNYKVLDVLQYQFIYSSQPTLSKKDQIKRPYNRLSELTAGNVDILCEGPSIDTGAPMNKISLWIKILTCIFRPKRSIRCSLLDIHLPSQQWTSGKC